MDSIGLETVHNLRIFRSVVWKASSSRKNTSRIPDGVPVPS